jgi:EmrB/QacA subfamily drug resistance transporter
VGSQQRTVLVVAILASFVAFLDGAIINVALPAIAREIGGGLVTQQWVVDAYMITLGALILLAGSLSDTFGRLRILRIGLIGFAATSLACALAPTDIVLIIARAFQGVTGALLVPSSLALIISRFKHEAQSRAIGLWTGWTGTAFIAGPLLGGILVDTVSWRLIFAVNIVPVAVTLWLMHNITPDAIEGKAARIDVAGAILGMLGLGGVVYGLIAQDRFGWTNPSVLVGLIGGTISFGAFLWWERRTRDPMLPLQMFRIRNFGMGNVATLAIYGALAFGLFAITVYIQQSAGFSAIAAGLATLPTTILMLFLSPVFGKLAGRFGPRLFMTIGPVIAGGGYVLMLSVTSDINYWTQLLPGVILFGLGLATTVAPLTYAILSAIDERQAGIGSAINNAISRIAGLVTVALAGIIVGGHLDLTGFHRAVVFAAILLISGGVISFLGIRNPRPVATND